MALLTWFTDENIEDVLQRIEAIFQDLQDKGLIDKDLTFKESLMGWYRDELDFTQQWVDGQEDAEMKELGIENYDEYIELKINELFHDYDCQFVFKDGYVFLLEY